MWSYLNWNIDTTSYEGYFLAVSKRVNVVDSIVAASCLTYQPTTWFDLQEEKSFTQVKMDCADIFEKDSLILRKT